MAKGDKFYFDNFVECTALAKNAATHLVSCLENYDPNSLEAMLNKMHEFEHAADLKKHAMEDALAKAFVTPVDREDLDMLSHKIDDVLDILEEILQNLYIYDIKTIAPTAVEYSKNILKVCEILGEMMGEFENFKKSKKLRSLIIQCNDMEEDCDKLYLLTMRSLTKSAIDTQEKFCWYKIYDCFEDCVDACEHVSECVGSIVMKNT